MGGGWTKTTSKTTGGSKITKTRRTSKAYSGGSVDGSLFLTLLLLIPFGIIMYLWPITIPYIIGSVIAIVAIVVAVRVLIWSLPWMVLGGILYGLYKLWELYARL
jgi:hypothetical protein